MFRPRNKDELRQKIENIVGGGDIPESWDLSAITDYIDLFRGITDFSRLTFIQNWNVSRAIKMTSMFLDCTNFNIPLNDWDVSSVKDMNFMFSGCINFNQPLNKWIVSEVEDMNFMFEGCTNFNQDLNDWNVSKVKYMESMFEGCTNFNQPLNKWIVSEVKYMTSMFRGCTNFNQPLNDWKLSNVRKKEELLEIFLNSGMSQDNMPMTLEERAERTKRAEQKEHIEKQLAKHIKLAEQQSINDKKEEQPFPECVICGEYLNNSDGPGPSEKCHQENCNDVVNVCENNHLFHRGCILNSCNAEKVDAASQMGFDQFQSYQTQSIATKCPLCKNPLIPNCEGLRNKERVPTEQIDENGLIAKGVKRKRKTLSKRKTKANRKTQAKRKIQGKRKTKKGKKSRKTKKRKH
jgi:surface protein